MKIEIKDLVDKHFPNKNQFGKAIGVGFPAACRLYDGTTTKINLDTLEAICVALDCTPNDIFSSDNVKRLKAYHKLSNKL